MSKEKEKKEDVSADAEKEVEVPKKFKGIVEEIEKMSVLDLSELVKILEKKFGVSSASPVAIASASFAEAQEGEEEKEEKTSFNVQLTAVGDKKLDVIKTARDLMEKGLKEAKDIVDAVATGPQMIKENASKEDAENIKKKFEEAGAKIELK